MDLDLYNATVAIACIAQTRQKLKIWTKKGGAQEKTKAPTPEVHGVGTLPFLIASPLPLGRGEQGEGVGDRRDLVVASLNFSEYT